MSRILCSLISLVMALSGSTVLEKTHTDPNHSFQIRYPAGWKVIPAASSSELIRADLISPDQKNGIQIRLYPDRGLPLEDFSRWYVRQFIRDMQCPGIMDQRVYRRGNRKTAEISFDGRQRNGYFLKSYLLPRGNQVAVLQAGTPFARRHRVEPLLDAIARSFQWLPAPDL